MKISGYLFLFLIVSTVVGQTMNLHFYGNVKEEKQKPKTHFENYWKLLYLNGREVNINAFVEPHSMTFDYNGLIMRFNYGFQGDKIKVTLDENFKRVKSSAQIEVENTFLNCTKYEIIGNEFLMKNANGELKVGFVRENTNKIEDGSIYVETEPVQQDIPPPTLKRSWKVIRVNNNSVSFDASITQSKIQYKYCNEKVWIYFSSDDGSFKAVQQKIPAVMNCSNLKVTQNQIDKAFKSVASYKIIRTQLYLYNSKKEIIIVFESKNFVAEKSPIAKVWTTSLVGDVSAVIVLNITQDFIQFTYQNEITMPYRIQDDQIEIGLGWPGVLNTTQVVYPSEAHILKAFTHAKTYLVSTTNLVFFDQNDNVLVKLSAGDNSFYQQNIPTITQSWRVTTVNNTGGYGFNLNITDNQILYTYTQPRVMNYSINGNIIHLSPPSFVNPQHKPSSPNHYQQIIQATFQTITNYRLQTSKLNFLNKDNVIVMILTRPNPSALIKNKGTLKPR